MLASTMTKADLNTGAPSLAMSMAKSHLCVFPVRSTIMLSTAVLIVKHLASSIQNSLWILVSVMTNK